MWTWGDSKCVLDARSPQSTADTGDFRYCNSKSSRASAFHSVKCCIAQGRVGSGDSFVKSENHHHEELGLRPNVIANCMLVGSRLSEHELLLFYTLVVSGSMG